VTLGINGWRILGQRTGVGRYLFDLVRHWDADLVRGRFDQIAFYTPRPTEIELPVNIQRRTLGPDCRLLLWENLCFGPRAEHDVLFCPSFSRPLVVRGKPVVVLFEATYKLYPDLFPRRYWFSFPSLYLRLYEWSGKNAALVVTTSEAAKADLIAAYGVPREKIRVSYLAPSDIFQPATESSRSAIRRKYLGDDVPFFLNTGKLSPVRNVPKIVEAFAAIKKDRQLPHRMLFAGPRDASFDFDALVAHHGVQDECIHAGYVPDADLVPLYSAAEAFILPYAYQTVSLPPLEAMACGTPAIVSGTAGLRETTGDSAWYLDQSEVDEIAEAMRTLATDAAIRADYARRGRDFTSTLSPKRTAAETMDILVEAASQ
jgi:glycosyltransferase involved in cell wall biosynthesis